MSICVYVFCKYSIIICNFINFIETSIIIKTTSKNSKKKKFNYRFMSAQYHTYSRKFVFRRIFHEFFFFFL